MVDLDKLRAGFDAAARRHPREQWDAYLKAGAHLICPKQ
jgi:hypothetical protein